MLNWDLTSSCSAVLLASLIDNAFVAAAFQSVPGCRVSPTSTSLARRAGLTGRLGSPEGNVLFDRDVCLGMTFVVRDLISAGSAQVPLEWNAVSMSWVSLEMRPIDGDVDDILASSSLPAPFTGDGGNVVPRVPTMPAN
jgi:hypothetical protein